MSFINKNPYFPQLIRNELEKAGMKEIGDDEDSSGSRNADKSSKIYYCDISYGKRNHANYKKCEIVNQLQDVNILGNKKMQYDNHIKYYKKRPDYIPMTASFRRENIDTIQSLFQANKKFILKPENELSRKGVAIVRNHLELIQHLANFPNYHEWIIQEYIDNPLLFNDKKFHFRVYVVYLQNSEYQAAYIGKKGFIYTANNPFRPDTIDNDVVLSGENAKENVFYTPEDFIKDYGKKIWDNKIVPQFIKIARETLKSALSQLQCPAVKQKCFKILGYDILIDKDFTCYLAEINARNVSYKYPNEEFKESFYKNILKLVLSDTSLSNQELIKQGLPYERILFQNDGNIIEGFNGEIKIYQQIQPSSFNAFFWKYIFPFILIVLIILAILLRK
jgi:hypothetical protein